MALSKTNVSLINFSKQELRWILAVAFIFAFGLGFRLWGAPTTDEFSLAVGLTNLLFIFLGLIVVIFLHEAGRKAAGALIGYETHSKPFKAGLVMSAIVTVYSQGLIPLITPNLIETDARPDLRHGKFRRYDNPADSARVALGGIVGSVIGISFMRVLYNFIQTEAMFMLVVGSCLYMIYSLVPFELFSVIRLRYFDKTESHTPGNGLHLMWWSWIGYVFALSFALLFSAVVLFTGQIPFVLIVILAAFMAWAYTKWLRS